MMLSLWLTVMLMTAQCSGSQRIRTFHELYINHKGKVTCNGVGIKGVIMYFTDGWKPQPDRAELYKKGAFNARVTAADGSFWFKQPDKSIADSEATTDYNPTITMFVPKGVIGTKCKKYAHTNVSTRRVHSPQCNHACCYSSWT